MKKLVAAILSCIMLTTNCVNVYAAEQNDNWIEIKKQEEIDVLIDEINEIALQEKIRNSELHTTTDLMSKSRNEEESKYKESKENCDALLEQMGVNKIDPLDKNDMKILEDMQKDFAKSTGNCVTMRTNDALDSAPDFSMLANIYTLYIYNGIYKYNNTDYNYRYIKVVDDKGYNGLYYYQDNDLAVNIPYTVIESVLSYNFGYGVSYLIGKLKYGTVIDWTLGMIFDSVAAVEDAMTISCGSKPLYGVRHASVTSMTYYFFYNEGWHHIGTGGTAEIVREDYLYANINGSPVLDENEERFTIKSEWIWHDYVEQYAKAMSYMPEYCAINRIGELQIKGYNGRKYYFAPVYAELPSDLL